MPTIESMSMDAAAAQLISSMEENEKEQKHERAEDDKELEGSSDEESSDDQEKEASQDEESEDDGEGQDDKETEEGSDAEASGIETLEDLAQALDQPLSELEDNLTATVKVNGESRQVTLKELISGFQLEQASRQSMQKTAEDRKKLDVERQTHIQQIDQQHQVLANILSQIRESYVGQLNSAELQRLSVENPEAYNQARWQLQDRLQSFDRLLQEGAQAYQALESQRSGDKDQKLKQFIETEEAKLLEADPSWDATRSKAVIDYLRNHPMAPQDLFANGNPMSAFEMVLAHDAMLYRQMKEKGTTAEKKVKQLPKLLKSGPKKAPVNVANDALKKAKARFSKSRSIDDAAAILAQSF